MSDSGSGSGFETCSSTDDEINPSKAIDAFQEKLEEVFGLAPPGETSEQKSTRAAKRAERMREWEAKRVEKMKKMEERREAALQKIQERHQEKLKMMEELRSKRKEHGKAGAEITKAITSNSQKQLLAAIESMGEAMRPAGKLNPSATAWTPKEEEEELEDPEYANTFVISDHENWIKYGGRPPPSALLDIGGDMYNIRFLKACSVVIDNIDGVMPFSQLRKELEAFGHVVKMRVKQLGNKSTLEGPPGSKDARTAFIEFWNPKGAQECIDACKKFKYPTRWSNQTLVGSHWVARHSNSNITAKHGSDGIVDPESGSLTVPCTFGLEGSTDTQKEQWYFQMRKEVEQWRIERLRMIKKGAFDSQTGPREFPTKEESSPAKTRTSSPSKEVAAVPKPTDTEPKAVAQTPSGPPVPAPTPAAAFQPQPTVAAQAYPGAVPAVNPYQYMMTSYGQPINPAAAQTVVANPINAAMNPALQQQMFAMGVPSGTMVPNIPGIGKLPPVTVGPSSGQGLGVPLASKEPVQTTVAGYDSQRPRQEGSKELVVECEQKIQSYIRSDCSSLILASIAERGMLHTLQKLETRRRKLEANTEMQRSTVTDTLIDMATEVELACKLACFRMVTGDMPGAVAACTNAGHLGFIHLSRFAEKIDPKLVARIQQHIVNDCLVTLLALDGAERALMADTDVTATKAKQIFNEILQAQLLKWPPRDPSSPPILPGLYDRSGKPLLAPNFALSLPFSPLSEVLPVDLALKLYPKQLTSSSDLAIALLRKEVTPMTVFVPFE